MRNSRWVTTVAGKNLKKPARSRLVHGSQRPTPLTNEKNQPLSVLASLSLSFISLCIAFAFESSLEGYYLRPRVRGPIPGTNRLSAKSINFAKGKNEEIDKTIQLPWS